MLKWLDKLLRPVRRKYPPSDLRRVEFTREGNDGRIWKYYLDGEDAKLWDECLRTNLRSTKGFLELNWQRTEVKDLHTEAMNKAWKKHPLLPMPCCERPETRTPDCFTPLDHVDPTDPDAYYHPKA